MEDEFVCPRCGHVNEDSSQDSDFGRICGRCFIDVDLGRATFSGHMQRGFIVVMYLMIGFATAMIPVVALMLAFEPGETGRNLLVYAGLPLGLAIAWYLWRRRGRSQFIDPKHPPPPD